MDPVFSGLILLLVLLFSAFLTAARTALGSARRQVLRERAEKGDAAAQRAAAVAEDSSRVIGTFHLAIVLAHFLLAGLVIGIFLPPLAGALSAQLPLHPVAALLISYLLVILPAALIVYVLTDLLPDMLVHRDAENAAILLAGPARFVIWLMWPLVSILVAIRRLVASTLGDDQEPGTVTEEEIMTLVDAGEEEGSIQLGEKEMIYSIFQLNDTVAREIMVPRIDIVALDVNTPLERAREVIIGAGHSRIPLYEESLDRVIGLVYAKDLLSVWHRGEPLQNLRSLLRPALFIPESKRVPDLLHELRNAKVHMAIVIDEYGGTAGLVTLEDIVEEIVGEIFDEYDSSAEEPYQMVSPDEYIVDARMNLDDFNDLLDVTLSDEMGDTLGGFIYGELGKVPQEGEVVTAGSLRLEVISVHDRRIRKVRVRRTGSPAEPASSQEEAPHANPREH